MQRFDGPCPYHVGEIVYYWPSERTRNQLSNKGGWQDLAPGSYLRIAAIEDGQYVVPEGFQNWNGVHWSVFAEASIGREIFQRERRHLLLLVGIAAIVTLIVIGIYIWA